MDSVLFGSEALGDQVFQICLQLFNTLLGRLRTSIPTPFDRPLNLLFNTTSNRMYVYAVDSLQPFVDGGNVNGDDGTVRKKWMFEVKRLVNGQEIEKNESPSIGDKDKRVQRPLSATMPFTAQFFKPYFSSPDDDDSGKPIIVY
jgi:hypothetical protein